MELIWFLFFFPAVIPAFSRHTSVPVVKGGGGGEGVGVLVQKALFISLILQIPVIAFLREKTKSSLKKKRPRGNKYRKNFKFSSEIINL